MRYFLLAFLLLPLFGWEYYTHGSLQTLTPLPNHTRSLNIHYFKDTKERTIGATNRIILKKRDKCANKWLARYPYKELQNGDILLFTKNIEETFTVAKELYESGCVYFAHPDFLVPIKMRSYDPLFSQQWNFYNIGQGYSVPNVDLNVYEAWQYATGRGVKVAVIDNGFDLGHEDLQGAFVDQIDLVDNDNNASFDNNFELHGTACAGLIAARKNGRGVQGTAYDAALIGIKLIGNYPDGSEKSLFVSSIVAAFWYAKSHGADVINCSWGTYDVADAVRDAINDVAYNGRDGKGTVIVFASGNEGRGDWFWGNDESALPSVLAIGAVTNLGDVAWYSNYGPELDFVAPSGGGTLRIATTDIRGVFGYADGSFGHPDYCYATDTTGFNGTSAAAPQISGVVALMLQRDPELTRDKIVAILKQTARKIGGDIYDEQGHNDYFGYGLVDAKAAVEEVIRRKVQKDVVNKTFALSGYFFHIGDGKFDWIYVSKNLKFVCKLEGMDEHGYLRWNILQSSKKRGFDTISLDGPVITFGKSLQTGALYQQLAHRSFVIDGDFVHYSTGAYEWIYIDKNSLKSFKLERLSYTGSFLWIPLDLSSYIENDKVSFK
ncbi:S8 family peptidase [Nitratiruptor tergarcus]|uniref:Subtilisin-like serine proteases n=1 Tax=Nitratiruptor tergarcus DSM 16512 TaxID=1069081 RepID=A0A1W1WVG6_9BACT|nr:S8 family serine peptidase [Nitratiruptor tergarcus]SMC10172.1 Subtilisin-like serine proteases [Nitratiruptor tergarcus DSM 16512]